MKDKIYDVIIIGGGPTGSTAATNLSKKGLDVIVLEKERFPRFHVGESLLPFCYHIFEELGVLAEMESNFLRKPGVTFSNIDDSKYSHWCFEKVIKDPSQLSFHVRRDQFDQILLENSRKVGAEVREEAKVLSIDFESSPSLVIVEIKTKLNINQAVKGKTIIDATGQDSFLGNFFQTKEKQPNLSQRIALFTHWKNADLDIPLEQGAIRIINLEGEKKGWIWMIPIDDNLLSVGVVVELNYFKKQKKYLVKKNENWLTDLYLQEVFSSKICKNILGDASRLLPIHIKSDYSYRVSQKYGDRYAIIGDAAAFLDPIFSSGVYLGMKSALLVTDAWSEQVLQGNSTALKEAYENIEGAYALVEKLITAFYNPDKLQFSEIDEDTFNLHDKHDNAFSRMHLILAGDFFKNHLKYTKALDMLMSKKKIDSFKNLTNYTREIIKEPCILTKEERIEYD
jgi:flavin-dependent dehydrogenase